MSRIAAVPIRGNLLRFLFVPSRSFPGLAEADPRMGGRPIGRTPDSGSGYPGSSPGLPAKLFNSLALRRSQTWEYSRLRPYNCVSPGTLQLIDPGEQELLGPLSKPRELL